MRFNPRSTRRADQQPSWSGMAVLIEAMVLMMVLVGSLAIIMQLFATATIRAREGQQLAEAVAYATSAAESFASDPTAAEGTSVQNGLIVQCQVTDQKTTAGTLYHATITVLDESTAEPVYELVTSQYQSEVKR